MARLLLLFVLQVVIFPIAHSQEAIKVGVQASLEKFLPKKVQDIKNALASTGLMFHYFPLPNERAIQMLGSGDMALDLYRQPQAMQDFSDLIQVNPAVDVLKLWLYTHPSTPHLCQPKTHKKVMVVGVLGIHWFENYIFPKFNDHEVVHNFDQAFNLVANGRVGVSLLNKKGIQDEMANTGLKVHTCSNGPFITLKHYTYVHSAYAWLVPDIERAYRQHFSNR